MALFENEKKLWFVCVRIEKKLKNEAYLFVVVVVDHVLSSS